MPDLINGLFETLGAAFLTLNVLQIRRDRTIKGVDWRSVLFFTAWGFWNLKFYSGLEQWFSLCGGVLLVAVNAVWLGHVAVYSWSPIPAGKTL